MLMVYGLFETYIILNICFKGEESDPELDLLAETESDSDDNHSNQDAASAQRSVQTGATAGSDTGKETFLILII